MFTRPRITAVPSERGLYNSAVCVVKLEPDGTVGLTRAALKAMTTHLVSEVMHKNLAYVQVVCIKDHLDNWQTGATNGELCAAILLGFSKKIQSQNIRRHFRSALERFKESYMSQGMQKEDLAWVSAIVERLEMLTHHGADLLGEEFDTIEAQTAAYTAAFNVKNPRVETDIWTRTYALMPDARDILARNHLAIEDLTTTLVQEAAAVVPTESAAQHEEFYGPPYDLSLNSQVFKCTDFTTLTAVNPAKMSLDEQATIILTVWVKIEAAISSKNIAQKFCEILHHQPSSSSSSSLMMMKKKTASPKKNIAINFKIII